MNKNFKERINFYVIYLLISLVFILIPIFCFMCFLLTADIGENVLSNNISQTFLNTCFYILIIFTFLFLFFRNFLLIWLWMFVRKYQSQSKLMQFFKTLQNDNSTQITVILFSLILDILGIFIEKSVYGISLWSDSVYSYLYFHSGGLITNFVIFIIFLRIDTWISRSSN